MPPLRGWSLLSSLCVFALGVVSPFHLQFSSHPHSHAHKELRSQASKSTRDASTRFHLENWQIGWEHPAHVQTFTRCDAEFRDSSFGGRPANPETLESGRYQEDG